MGSGASKAPAISLAVKESRAKAAQLEKELEKLEAEKAQLSKELAARSSDIEKLGEMNRVLEKNNSKLLAEIGTTKEEVASADNSIGEVKSEMELVKKQASKYEAEVRDLKGELIVIREEYLEAKEEVERVGELLTSTIEQKVAAENAMKSIEEEKDLLEQMLRAVTESESTYKELSTKLITKRKADAEKDLMGSVGSKMDLLGKQQSVKVVQLSSNPDDPMKLKTAGKLKICIISTFEDFFVEREALTRLAFEPFVQLCDDRGYSCEVVDLWSGMTANEQSFATGFSMANIYFNEILAADVVLVLLDSRYGNDIGEEAGSAQAACRPWLSTQKSLVGWYGSPLELATVYAAFYCGRDSSEPVGSTAGRTVVYIRDPDYVKGLPEAVTSRFMPEGVRNAMKLSALKERLRSAGLVRDESYRDPEALAVTLKEYLLNICEKSLPQRDELDRLTAMHNAYMDRHAWLGQGAKGRSLPESVDVSMERIRKFVISDVQQPLVIVGEAGSGRTSLLQAAIARLAKRFPPPDTEIFSHFCGCCRDAQDPLTWIYKTCLKLKSLLNLSLDIPFRPYDMEIEFRLWLEAASHTGIKIFLILDSIDRFSKTSNASSDLLFFLPKLIPPGIRCIVSTGAGPALTNLAQRGCSAITIWPIDEQQKQVMLDTFLSNYKKTLDKKGQSRIVKSERTSNPCYLVSTLEEIRSIGVLDGVATLEPILYYLEADNIGLLIEKALYRWESAYNGKIIGGSLVRDALTCIWASRLGLRREELTKMLSVTCVQISPLLMCCTEFISNYTGYLNLSSQALFETVQRRYLTSPDAISQVHAFLANFFNLSKSCTLSRRIDEVPWQISKSGDTERLCKFITDPEIFLHLYDPNRRRDLWRYFSFLEQQNAHRNLGTYCKTSSIFMDQMEPMPELAYLASLNHSLGSWLAEIGFMEVATQLLLKALEMWLKCIDGDDPRMADTTETLAKVLANIQSPEAEKYFERALQIRSRLGSSQGPTAEMASLCNDYGLYQKRDGKHAESLRQFLRAADLWTRIYGAEHLCVANANLNLCTASYAIGNLQQAEEYAQTCLLIRKSLLGTYHPLYAEALCNLAAVELARGRTGRPRKEAEKQLREAISILETTRGSRHPDTLWARSFLDDSVNDEDDLGFEDDY